MAGVVVGVHHAKASGAAVRWASEAAALRGSPLTLVHAWSEPLDLTVDLDPVSLPDLVGPATSSAVHATAATALLACDPELLVLGGHRGARHRSHLTRTCLQHASCPVVVVPDTEQSPAGRVVVGTSGSEGSMVALRWAAEEAQLRHATLLVCYAWALHSSSAQDLRRPTRAIAAQQAAACSLIHQWLRQIPRLQQIEVQLTHGGPLDGLLEASTNADLLVVGRSDHTGLSRLLNGGVSNDLSGLAPCPVAVIPARHAGVACTSI